MKEMDGRMIIAAVIVAIAAIWLFAIYFDEFEWNPETRSFKARKNPTIDSGPGPMILEGS